MYVIGAAFTSDMNFLFRLGPKDVIEHYHKLSTDLQQILLKLRSKMDKY
jgi:hypothetical protein